MLVWDQITEDGKPIITADGRPIITRKFDGKEFMLHPDTMHGISDIKEVEKIVTKLHNDSSVWRSVTYRTAEIRLPTHIKFAVYFTYSYVYPDK